jgi:uncharacterized protein
MGLQDDYRETMSERPPRRVPRPVMFQNWRSLTFLHWACDAAEVRRLLPAQVVLDTFDGAAWIGLTPFLLTDLRPPFVPALPWISRFPEMNVRTYVRGPDGRRGIWFFTLEADRLLAVAGARLSYGLPYRWAQMSVRRNGTRVDYESVRHWPFGSARSNISIEVGGSIQSSEFTRFLTARYRLYTRVLGRTIAAQIEHDPWPLHEARVLKLEQNVIEACKLPRVDAHPHVLHSHALGVRIERPHFLA